MDHLTNLENLSPYLIALSLLSFGFLSSLHCLSMCGALVTSSCQKNHLHFPYQGGRLLGYLIITILVSLFGLQFRFYLDDKLARIIINILLSGVYIFWGLSIYRGKPYLSFHSITKNFQFFWGKAYSLKSNWRRSLFVGLLSPLLPCGVFYGALLALAISQNTLVMIIGIIFFWIGTLPSLVLAPSLIHKLIRPLQQRNPKILSLSLVSLGLVTINLRTIIDGVLYVCH